MHTPADRYRFFGEFHYFRLPRETWTPRLEQIRALGFEGVSIYVPWNWHQPSPGPIDFAGSTLPERDLRGVLDRIGDTGLGCIYRPGPFITAEWRHGGIPAWLWQGDPSMLALDATGRPAGEGRPYPALTYTHPGYEGAATAWLAASIQAIEGYLASNGGPVVHLQLDDEPSWWQQLWDPLALDFSPFLVAPRDGQPSRYADWLIRRHGDLAQVNRTHRTTARTPADIEPPRAALTDRRQLARHLDWLDFKLDVINEHVAVLHAAAREAGFDGPLSMLQPYLMPLQAATFAAFARERMPDLELTNECYVSLFSATAAPEQKVAHVIATHEAYHMWRGPDQGPAFSMELQGSNSSFISPGVMETLYAVTLARAIRGFNIYMLVGGQNPPGYELGTGREYDLDAPIGRDGNVRPHAAVLERQIQVVRAIEQELLRAEPLRDTWVAGYLPNEAAAAVDGSGALGDTRAAMAGIFSFGDIGLSGAQSLTALLTLAGVSWGVLDLEGTDGMPWHRARQLWVPGLGFMSAAAQQRLLGWIADGGHAVFLPSVPLLDESMGPCDVLARAIFSQAALPVFPAFEPAPVGWDQVRTASGGSLAVPRGLTRFDPAPGAEPLAWDEDRAVVGFRRTVGAGSATVLGFRLQYHPVGGGDQFRFAADLVRAATGSLAAVAEPLPAVALELAGPDGGLLCVIDPVDLPMSVRVAYTLPGTHERATLPTSLLGIPFAGRGARLLPIGIRLDAGRRLRYATAELLGRQVDVAGRVDLKFAAQRGEAFEIALEGVAGRSILADGELVTDRSDADGTTTLVIDPSSPEVIVSILP
jgi:beta-galactosidase